MCNYAWLSHLKATTIISSRQTLLQKKFISATFVEKHCLYHTSRSLSYAQKLKFPPLPLQAKAYSDRVAIIDQNGKLTYSDLLKKAETLATIIQSSLKTASTQERIAFLCPNDFTYVVSQWAAFLCGHIAVPLCSKHPEPQLDYVVGDSQAKLLIGATAEYVDRLKPIASKRQLELVTMDKADWCGAEVINDTDKPFAHPDDKFYKTAKAMILYTSGTTGLPKGVVISHSSLAANFAAIASAWEWTKNDVMLHCLPLHHVHGVVKALMAPLSIGACVRMMPKFEAKQVWDNLVETGSGAGRVNMFTAVPTMYVKLIEEYDKLYGDSPKTKEFIKAACKQNIRMMISGSAALPEPIHKKWTEITGHVILERYGMTEILMAITNPLHGQRKPGFIGNPYPSVEVRLAQPDSYSSTGFRTIAEGNFKASRVTPGMEKEVGELHVRGPSVFKEYWNKPEATEATFTKDGWFKTGDTVQYLDGSYKILGRTSVDIIKSGGYKISALDIERHLLSHPCVLECAVVGVTDITWGQKVAAVLVAKNGAQLKALELGPLREWCKERMPSYTAPSVVKIVPGLKRNVVGKVNKKELLKELFPESQ